MIAGVMWRLCGFCGAKLAVKKTRGLLSLECDESKEIRCHQGELFQQSANQALMTVFGSTSSLDIFGRWRFEPILRVEYFRL